MCCCMVTVVRHIVHSDLKTICASHPLVELAKQVLLYQRGLFLNARPLFVKFDQIDRSPLDQADSRRWPVLLEKIE